MFKMVMFVHFVAYGLMKSKYKNINKGFSDSLMVNTIMGKSAD